MEKFIKISWVNIDPNKPPYGRSLYFEKTELNKIMVNRIDFNLLDYKKMDLVGIQASRTADAMRRQIRGECIIQVAPISKNLNNNDLEIYVKDKASKIKFDILWEKYNKYLDRSIILFWKHLNSYKKRKYRKIIKSLRKKIVKLGSIRRKLDWVDLGVKR